MHSIDFIIKRATIVNKLAVSVPQIRKSYEDGSSLRERFSSEPAMDPNEMPKDYFHENGYYGKDDTICLVMGAPGNSVLKKCSSYLQTATVHRMEKEKETGNLFQYGPSLGDWRYRKNLAEFLTNGYKEKVDMKNLMVTGGASQGLYLTASLLFKKGSVVFVEDPTFFVAIHVLQNDLGMDVVPVSLDAEGMSLTLLEDAIEKHVRENVTTPFSAMVYLIPAYQNPTGICYSEERCEQLVRLAEKYKLLLLCDDVYNLLPYKSAKPPKPLVFYDKTPEGYVISNCTFSKIMAPGLRLGWIQSSPRILDFYVKSSFIRSGGNVNNYMSGIMASVLELGLQKSHLDETRELYKKQMEEVCRALKEFLPKECDFTEPEGGYFVWITLPKNIIADDFVQWTKERYGIVVHAGNKCSIVGNFKNCIRIAITFYELEAMLDAVRRLCRALSAFIKTKENKT